MNILAGLLLVTFLILSLIRHRWLILVYIASIGWIPYQAGRDIVGPANLDSAILFVVCIISIPSLISRFKLGRFGKFALIYWVFSVLSNLISIGTHSELAPYIVRQMLKDCGVLGFLLVLDSDLRLPDFIPQVVVALCVAALGGTLTTLIDYFFPGLGIAELWHSKDAKISIAGGMMRYAGTLGESYMSGALIIGAFAVCMSILAYGKRMMKYRFLAVGAIPFIFIGVLAGQSRSTYIGMGVILLCMFLKPRFFFVAAIGLILGYVVIHSSPELSERFFGRIGQTTGTMSGRTELWMEYLSRIPPVVLFIGEGFTTMTFREDVAGHMSYMEVFSDTGIPGLILFISLWYHVITAPKRIALSAQTTTQYVLGRAAVWASYAFLISSAGIGLIVNNTYRLIFMSWIAVALAQAWDQPEDIAIPVESPEGGAVYLDNSEENYLM